MKTGSGNGQAKHQKVHRFIFKWSAASIAVATRARFLDLISVFYFYDFSSKKRSLARLP